MPVNPGVLGSTTATRLSAFTDAYARALGSIRNFVALLPTLPYFPAHLSILSGARLLLELPGFAASTPPAKNPRRVVTSNQLERQGRHESDPCDKAHMWGTAGLSIRLE